MRLRLTYGHLKTGGLFLLFLLSFRILLRTPIEKGVLLLEAGLEVLLVGFTVVYLVSKAFSKRISKFEVYVLIVCLLPFLSSITAYYFFHQPLQFGLLAQRNFYLILTGLLLLVGLQKGWIKLNHIKTAMLWLSWTCLISYLLVNFTVNPVPFKESGFVGFNSLKGGYLFRFNMIFIVFGCIYYFISMLKRVKRWHFLWFLFFLGYLLFIRQDRTIVVSTLLVLVLTLLYQIRTKRGLYISLATLGLLILGGGALFLTRSEATRKVRDLYANSFNVLSNVGNSKATGNGSVRVSEIDIAWKGIKRSPILGMGKLSNQYNDGFSGVYGHFYPADVGFVGVTYLYGLLGLLLFFYQARLWAKYGRRALKSQGEHSLFLLACFLFFLQFFLNSLTDGRIAFRTAISIVFLCILYYSAYVTNWKKQTHLD